MLNTTWKAPPISDGLLLKRGKRLSLHTKTWTLSRICLMACCWNQTTTMLCVRLYRGTAWWVSGALLHAPSFIHQQLCNAEGQDLHLHKWIHVLFHKNHIQKLWDGDRQCWEYSNLFVTLYIYYSLINRCGCCCVITQSILKPSFSV